MHVRLQALIRRARVHVNHFVETARGPFGAQFTVQRLRRAERQRKDTFVGRHGIEAAHLENEFLLVRGAHAVDFDGLVRAEVRREFGVGFGAGRGGEDSKLA